MSIKLMAKAWEMERLKNGKKLVMLALCDFANDDGVCYPSRDKLAKKASLDKSTVSKIIDWLEQQGLITSMRRQTSMRRNSDLYQINVDAMDRFIESDGDSAEGGKIPPTEGGKIPPTEGGKIPPTEGGKIPPTGSKDVYGVKSNKKTIGYSDFDVKNLEMPCAEGGKIPPTEGGKIPPTEGGKIPPTEGGKIPPSLYEEPSDINRQYNNIYKYIYISPQPENSTVADGESFVAAEAATDTIASSENLQPQKKPETKPAKAEKDEAVSKRFYAIAKVYNRVFENSPAVAKVSTEKLTINGKPTHTKQNLKRMKLVHYAWELAKQRVIGWCDENGLIDGEKPDSKHILKWFELYFDKCLKDEFINGSSRAKGYENWRANFDYMLRPQEIEKRVFEQ